MKVTRTTPWREVRQFQIPFDTHHPQGFARVGDALFLSSVEIIERTASYKTPREGMDRSTGRGKGHLFKMDLEGNLLAHIDLGEEAIYHPGGIDFDGTYLWVPVAEYRPDSESIIYRVDPETLDARIVFRFPDHVGGIVHDTASGTVHGVSWGSRRFYSWALERLENGAKSDDPNVFRQQFNPSHYIDYQDCQFAGSHRAFCSGVAAYMMGDGTRHSLGGLEMLDLQTGLPIHQAPFPYWTEDGLSLMQNPMHLELDGLVLRLYLMPEDNLSRLFIYEAEF
jgi:hypothetical protein